MISSYKKNKEWADRFLDDAKQIIGPLLIEWESLS